MGEFTPEQIVDWFERCPLAFFVWDSARIERWNAYAIHFPEPAPSGSFPKDTPSVPLLPLR
jgi:hypothetical protein